MLCIAAQPYCRTAVLAQAARPSAIIDLIRSGEQMRTLNPEYTEQRQPVPRTCDRCGYISSQVGGWWGE